MRIIVLLSILITVIAGYGQGYYKNHSDDSFKKLVDGGLVYVKTGNESFDNEMINALKEKWTVSDYEIKEKGEKPGKDKCFISRLRMSETATFNVKNSDVLVILPGQYYNNDISKYKAICYMYFNGFNSKIKKEDEHKYVSLLIGAIHSGIVRIKEDEVMGGGVIFYKNVSKAITEHNADVKGKRLIIQKDKKNHANVSKLSKYGINYKIVSPEEFDEIVKKGDEKDYLLHFAYNSYTDIGVLSAVTGELLFNAHFAGGYYKFKNKHLKVLRDHF